MGVPGILIHWDLMESDRFYASKFQNHRNDHRTDYIHIIPIIEIIGHTNLDDVRY